jgi:hypothetical protein
MHTLSSNKHSVLLGVLLISIALQPVARFGALGFLIYDGLYYFVAATVLLIVFEKQRDRLIGLGLIAPAIAANFVGHFNTDSGAWHTTVLVIYHSLMAALLAYAVAAILRGIFHSQRIRSDHVIGALTGLMIAAAAWSNLYILTDLLLPDAFVISAPLTPQLASEPGRRFVFSHLSFITLTTVGYGDVTPLAPVACALAWMEAIFGQFYVAVIIGQLIGLKLSQHDGTRR